MKRFKLLTDAELLALLHDDSGPAFAEIYDRYWGKMFVVARNRLHDESAAEEVVQDVFLSIWRRRAELQLEYSLSTYLSTAVKYQVIKRRALLHAKAQHLELNVAEGISVDSTQLWFNARELSEILDHAVDQLPEKCRIVFLKSRKEYQTNDQIARQLGISKKTVEAHITRALAILRTSLNVSAPFLIFLLKNR